MSSSSLRKMGACFPFIKKKQSGNKEITLAIFGLDNAGKTTTTRSIQGESLDTVAPTVGFYNNQFSIGKFNINLFDLGGGKTIRDIWKNYFAEIYGLIYVVDSSEPERLGEARTVLGQLLKDVRISGKPVLLLANKQDKESALDESEILAELNIEQLVNENHCPCNLERCSASLGVGKKMDKAIKKGLTWLLSIIDVNIVSLRERITEDVAKQQAIEAEEREARRERVRKIREERERERRERGEVDEDEDMDGSGENPTGDGLDPFKPLNVQDLEKKAAMEKASRRTEATPTITTEENETLGVTSSITPKAESPQPLTDNKDLVLEREEDGPEEGKVALVGSPVHVPMFRNSVGPAERNSDSSTSFSTVFNAENSNSRGKLLSPLEASTPPPHPDDTKYKKKKKKRSSKKNRLTPVPPSDDVTLTKEQPDGLARYPSNPNLFVTESVYTLDEIDEEALDSVRSARSMTIPTLPNGDIEELVT